MLVKEIMIRKIITIDVEDTVLTACDKYRDFKVGSLLVIDNGVCVGIVTERDLIERIICMHRDPEKTKVREIMSSNIVTVHALDSIEKALEKMKENRIKKLPVISDNKTVGVVTITDISNAKPELSRRFIESWVKPRWED